MEKAKIVIFKNVGDTIDMITNSLLEQFKINKRQKVLNVLCGIFVWATIENVHVLKKTIVKQNKKIEELTKKYEELKNVKGE